MTARAPAGTDISWKRWFVAAVVAAGVLSIGGIGSADAAPAGSRVLFRLDDHRIDEASGIGVGIRSPGAVYVQNDSGDSARFFALDRRTGRTLAVFTVPGAENVDWEDLAVARDARGVPSIWLADTGDNSARRHEVRIYRVDEPAVLDEPVSDGPVTETSASVTRRTGRPDVWRLRYPGGPVDVEALAVAPGGAMSLATKSPTGDTVVYSVPFRPDASTVRPVRRIGTFQVPAADGPFGGGSLLGLLVTAAAISPTGDRFVLRTYGNAYVWSLKAGNLAGALRTTPVRIALPAQPQGEGVTFDGTRLLIDSEGVGSAVWSVPLPAQPSTTPRTSVAAPTRSTAATAAAQASPASTARSGPTRTAVLGLMVALGLLVGAAILVRSRRGARR